MSNPFNLLTPSALDDFAFNNPASRKLLEEIMSGAVRFPEFGKCAICLYGTHGTGKTTLARLLPGMLEKTGNLKKRARDTSLFNQAECWQFTKCGLGNKGASIVDGIEARTKSDIASADSGWFYEILDEIDTLSPQAQGSLKALVAEESKAIFILTTNNPQKLDKGLIDRSHLIEMNQPPGQEMLRVARRYLAKLGPAGDAIPDATLLKIAEDSRGSMRDFMGTVMYAFREADSRVQATV